MLICGRRSFRKRVDGEMCLDLGSRTESTDAAESGLDKRVSNDTNMEHHVCRRGDGETTMP